MRFGSLFSGIGGMDLGLERAGMTCKWQVEIDGFCRKVLTKHWPNVPKFEDVREFPICDCSHAPLDHYGEEDDCIKCSCTRFTLGVERVDLIAGGFPCQDISEVGARKGINGARSGLWREMFRVVCRLRPRYVLVENVSGLLNRGIGRVLGDLASIGYDAEWSIVPACAMGASHTRERLFIVAYTNEQRSQTGRTERNGNGSATHARGERAEYLHTTPIPVGSAEWKAFAGEPELDRVAYGVPNRVERIKGLGNAVVPQVAQWIGERIMETQRASEYMGQR